MGDQPTRHGILSIENMPELMQPVDVQLSTEKDGRIWLNVDGICFIRFRPTESAAATHDRLKK